MGWIAAAIRRSRSHAGPRLILIWPASMIWAALSASNQHSRYQAWLAGR
jgi:hypothetical protein